MMAECLIEDHAVKEGHRGFRSGDMDKSAKGLDRESLIAA
jgi:hypothetical protein